MEVSQLDLVDQCVLRNCSLDYQSLDTVQEFSLKIHRLHQKPPYVLVKFVFHQNIYYAKNVLVFVGFAILTELCFVYFSFFLSFLIDDGPVSKVSYLLKNFITHTKYRNYALALYIRNE